MSLRLVQLSHPREGRRVAVVDEPRLKLLDDFTSIFRLANRAIDASKRTAQIVESARSLVSLHYDDVYDGRAEWKLLPAFDQPDEESRCLVTGTGLTHKASAENRQSMHGAQKTDE